MTTRKIIIKDYIRIPCSECGEDAEHRNTFLLEGDRSNPASKAFGKDDCSWCSDHEEFRCGECQPKGTPHGPDGYRWCSTFTFSGRFKHLFMRWEERPATEADLRDALATSTPVPA